MPGAGLLIFDLDGTVADTLPDIAASARFLAEELGCPPPDEAFVRSCIGGGAGKLVGRILGTDDPARIADAKRLFAEHYNAHAAVRTRLYDGVPEVLEHYAGRKRLAMATFKSRPAAERILAHFGIAGCFERLVTADDCRRTKPDPECVERILTALQVRPEDAVLIGDTVTDMDTGRNAGVLTCGVTYGYGSARDIFTRGPDYLVSRITDIQAIF